METLKLTKTPIVDMIWDGCGEQSPLAERFFQKLRCLYGLEPVACYADCRQIVPATGNGAGVQKNDGGGRGANQQDAADAVSSRPFPAGSV